MSAQSDSGQFKVGTLRPARRASSRRDAILSAGRDVFLRQGYHASIDAVAARAGVARRTVFNHFGSKEVLFEEILRSSSAAALPGLALKTTGDVRSNLVDFARRYVAAITGTEVVRIYRLLRTAAPQSVEALHRTQHANYAHIRDTLADYFAACVAAGRMRNFNCAHAAERFLAAAVGMARVDVSLGIETPRTGRDAYLREAVDGFLQGVAIR